MEAKPDSAAEQPDNKAEEKILKPKRTRTMTEEAKKQYGDRMRKVNEDRCEKARLKSEELLALKEQMLKEKLEKVESKKQQVRKLKEEKKNVPDVPAPLSKATVSEANPLKKQKAKRIVVQESSDSDDYFEGETDGESSEEEVVYVAKSKSKRHLSEAKKPQTITKAKKEKDIPIRQPEVPKTVIKFF